MAKLIVFVALFAIIAMAMAAPVEEQEPKKDDLKTASGIGLGFYGFPYGGFYGYGFPHFGYGYGLGHGYGYGFHKGFGFYG